LASGGGFVMKLKRKVLGDLGELRELRELGELRDPN
jgi:hypothetical protein